LSRPFEGKTCIVTGATSGLGRACAEQLAREGAALQLICRSPEKAERARGEIVMATGNDAIDIVIADLSSQAAIRGAAATLLSTTPRIDLLINNAGVTNLSREVTLDGIEATFAVNHLAYFLLTTLLLERIKESPGARVINIASDAHKFGGSIDLDDLGLEDGFGWIRAYGRSKGANILFTQELSRRLADSEVVTHAVHPGFVRSSLGANNGRFGQLVTQIAAVFAMPAERAARYVIALCHEPQFATPSGGYFYKAKKQSQAAWTQDEQLARRLWDRSEALVAESAAG
jgi:NAD(P)-dependent dehydrogenase (short-subunit alcohol dehydrogenase family)